MTFHQTMDTATFKICWKGAKLIGKLAIHLGGFWVNFGKCGLCIDSEKLQQVIYCTSVPGGERFF